MTNLEDKGLGEVLKDGQSLFSFLGQFWHRVYGDPGFAERFCDAVGLLSTQTEQRKNEAKAASGRRLLPVYSRERWMPARLSPITKNAGRAAEVELSETKPVEIGPQAGLYGNVAGMVPVVGPGELVSGYTTYAFPQAVVSAESLHECAFDPELELLPGKDFFIDNGSIFFRHGSDPADDSRFRKDIDGGGVIVWLKNAMVDRNFVSDYAGYVMKMHAASSKKNLDAVNAFWDLVNNGATIGGLMYFVCKALGVPCIENDMEVVQSVSEDDGVYTVTTDCNMYKSAVEPIVGAGQVLTHGAPLTAAARLSEDPRDVPGGLFLKQGFFKDHLVSGLGFSHDVSDLVFCGRDANGNPKLKFSVYGSPEDAESFFRGCWSRCEESGTDMSSLFDASVPAGAVEGDVVGQIEPMDFLLRNLVGTNVVFVQIELDLLDDEGRNSAGLLSRAFEVVPPGVCLVFCASPGEVREEYGCAGKVVDGTFTECIAEAPSDRYTAVTESVETFLVPGKEENNR